MTDDPRLDQPGRLFYLPPGAGERVEWKPPVEAPTVRDLLRDAPEPEPTTLLVVGDENVEGAPLTDLWRASRPDP